MLRPAMLDAFYFIKSANFLLAQINETLHLKSHVRELFPPACPVS